MGKAVRVNLPCMRWWTVPAAALLLFSCAQTDAAPPWRWASRGPGGGGAFFGPSISPHDHLTIHVSSDMGDTFFSPNLGSWWDTLDFRQFGGNNQMRGIQHTALPSVLYGLSEGTPLKSTDSGRTWTALTGDPTGGGAYCTYADGNRTNRVLVADYSHLYFSADGGASFGQKYTAADLHVGGVFFSGSTIFVGTRAGLLVSTDGGASFALSSISGIPGTESIVSFAGGQAGGTTRLFCVTLGSTNVYPGITGADYGSYRKIYRLDHGISASWTAATNGIGANYPFFVAMATNNISTVYVAGCSSSGEPFVARTTNGGTSWQSVFNTAGNANVATGWQGDDPGPWNWRKWSYGEFAEGFSVCPSDPTRAILTDLGFVHLTTNSGAVWQQAYVHAMDQNPTNTPTERNRSYHGVGLENTSCWHLRWSDSNHVYAAFTDMRGLLSTNGGQSWLFPTGLTYNSTYCSVTHPANGTLYAAASSVHDMYAWDRYLRDAYIDPGSGAVIASSNKGLNWQVLHNFANPVVWLALDPSNPNRMYASVVDSSIGGIYETTNLNLGASSTWAKLATPPRTQGHPYVVQVLNDGALVCSYSARLSGAPENFTASSGVFLSTNRGTSWVDRTAANMQYYTKDVVVDPYDAGQATWYAGVWGEWGNSSGKGGLYRTRDRGQNWTRITSGIQSAESCVVSPTSSNEAYITTETQGLWCSTNIQATSPTFTQVTSYPFRFPSRAFFNPYDANELWVCSYGNGMRLGRISEPSPTIVGMAVDAGNRVSLDVNGCSGQKLVLQHSSNLLLWTAFTTNLLPGTSLAFADDPPPSEHLRFYRAAVAP